MAKSSIIVRIDSGEIQNKVAVRTFFTGLSDGKWLLEADNSKKRTCQQNRYLHAVLIPEFRKALNGVGYDEVRTDEQAKLLMKSMFLTREIVSKETGEMLKYVEDTHNLTTFQLNELIEAVIKFAAENMNYQIPFPNEQLEMDYEVALAKYETDLQATLISRE